MVLLLTYVFDFVFSASFFFLKASSRFFLSVKSSRGRGVGVGRLSTSLRTVIGFEFGLVALFLFMFFASKINRSQSGHLVGREVICLYNKSRRTKYGKFEWSAQRLPWLLFYKLTFNVNINNCDRLKRNRIKMTLEFGLEFR